VRHSGRLSIIDLAGGESLAGDWASFVALNTRIPFHYATCDFNGSGQLPNLRPAYFLNSHTKEDRILGQLRSGPGEVRESMRILHLADHMGYGGTIPHGMTTYLLTVLPRLRAAGHDVLACFLREPHVSATELERQGVKTHFLNASRLDPRIPWRVARIVHDFRPDVLHATQIQATAVARLLHLRHRPYALVLHMHNLDVFPTPLRWVSRLLPQASSVLCVSKAAMHNAEIEYGLDPTRMRVFHNAFDTERFFGAAGHESPDLRQELGLDPKTPIIGRVARFHPDKGNDRLIRAMPEIVRAVPGVVAVFAGEGPERPACEQLAADLGVADAVRFLGHREDVARLVQSFDVMAITSPAEPFGYVALESFAAGKPVVGYSAGGLPEVVTHDIDGLLARADDHREFATLLIRVLRDQALHERLAEGARQALLRFSLGKHVDELLWIYANARPA
jgi:glycosyltransferase involved in cell wall biosynthesis